MLGYCRDSGNCANQERRQLIAPLQEVVPSRAKHDPHVMPFLKEWGQVNPFPSVLRWVVVCECARQRQAGVNAGEAARQGLALTPARSCA